MPSTNRTGGPHDSFGPSHPHPQDNLVGRPRPIRTPQRVQEMVGGRTSLREYNEEAPGRRRGKGVSVPRTLFKRYSGLDDRARPSQKDLGTAHRIFKKGSATRYELRPASLH